MTQVARAETGIPIAHVGATDPTLMPAPLMSEATNKMVELCREAFAGYDEFWLVGHKGDHHNTLSEMGVFGDEGPNIAVAHVHSTLGVRADHVVAPPAGTSSSYEKLIGAANPDIVNHVGRAVVNDKRVCVFMPFPNAGLSELIAQGGAEGRFNLTAPVDDPDIFLQVENKIGFARLVDRAIANDPEATANLQENIIPWTVLTPEHDYADLAAKFGLADGQAVYIQKDLSGGGDGTRRIGSQETLDKLLSDPEWRGYADTGRLKVTAEVVDAYPANGSACIIPTGDGDCIVLMDPLSHKPVGLEDLGGKEGSGVGNDWSTPWTKEVNDQYRTLVTLLGRQLYKEYGYTGQFGPDCLVQTRRDGSHVLRVNEINPRWQGTTPYQTYNALSAGRIPLELIHYAVKLDRNADRLPEILALIGDPAEYNRTSISSPGCFYMKVGGPKTRKEVTRDVNGHYVYADGELHGPFEDLSGVDVATARFASEAVTKVLEDLRSSGARPTVITVKAPNQGTFVGGELAPIGYIVGSSAHPVFSPDTPAVTAHGREMFQTVLRAMFEE